MMIPGDELRDKRQTSTVRGKFEDLFLNSASWWFESIRLANWRDPFPEEMTAPEEST